MQKPFTTIFTLNFFTIVFMETWVLCQKSQKCQCFAKSMKLIASKSMKLIAFSQSLHNKYLENSNPSKIRHSFMKLIYNENINSHKNNWSRSHKTFRKYTYLQYNLSPTSVLSSFFFTLCLFFLVTFPWKIRAKKMWWKFQQCARKLKEALMVLTLMWEYLWPRR